MTAHSFLNFIFLVYKGERSSLYSFFRECNLYPKAYKPAKGSLSSSQLFVTSFQWNSGQSDT